MGQTTGNISIYVPSEGETGYTSSFLAGQTRIDLHDHSGAPLGGVPIPLATAVNGVLSVVNGGTGVALLPKFSAYLSATTGFVTGDNTAADIQCDTVLLNTGAGYTPATGVFKAPQDGFYNFSSNVTISTTSITNTNVRFEFYGNVSNSLFFYTNKFVKTGSDFIAACGSLSVPMLINDTMQVKVTVFGSAAKDVTVIGDPLLLLTSFSGYLIP